MKLRLLAWLLVAGLLLALLPTPARAGGNISITRSFQPSAADSYVQQTDPSKNTGSDVLMWVDSKATQSNWRSFVSFSLSVIPTGSTVSSATLSLRMKDAPSSSRTLEAQRVASAWSESTITWDNQPGVSGSAVTTTTGTTSETTLSWPVTTDVQAFVDGSATNNGWRIKDQTEESSTEYKESFKTREESSDTANRPKLAVTFTAPWDSHTDSARANPPEDVFADPENTVYMRGTGFSTAQNYNVAYYDANGTRWETDASVTATGGTLDTDYVLTSNPTAAGSPPDWHAVAYPAAVTPPNSYSATDTDIVANDSFAVQPSAIPEFPTVLSAVVVAVLSFGIYWWMRRRRVYGVRGVGGVC